MHGGHEVELKYHAHDFFFFFVKPVGKGLRMRMFGGLMKIVISAIALWWLMGAAHAETAAPTPHSTLCEKLMGQEPQDFDFSKLSPEEQKSLKEELRELASKEGISPGNTAFKYLLKFGDEKAIGQLVAAFDGSDGAKARDAWDTAQFIDQPLLIPAFAKFLTVVDPPAPPPKLSGYMEGNYYVADGVVLPAATRAGIVIATVLYSSKQFSAKMRPWAEEMMGAGLGADTGFPERMQKWWERNRERIEAGRYKEVEPLREESGTKAPSEGS